MFIKPLNRMNIDLDLWSPIPGPSTLSGISCHTKGTGASEGGNNLASLGGETKVLNSALQEFDLG